jgi:hypothetical protein
MHSRSIGACVGGVIKNFVSIEGSWFEFKTREGVIIQLKIRPLFLDIASIIEARHKTSHLKKRAAKLSKKTKIDFQTLTSELIDYLLEDFNGIGSSFDTPLEPTAESKMQVLFIKGVTDFIMGKATELAEERIKEVINFEKTSLENVW